jgi:hypothetical protein
MKHTIHPRIIEKVTLVGASNLGQSLPHFSDLDLEFVGTTVPGWTPSPENITKMVSVVDEGQRILLPLYSIYLATAPNALNSLTELLPSHSKVMVNIT